MFRAPDRDLFHTGIGSEGRAERTGTQLPVPDPAAIMGPMRFVCNAICLARWLLLLMLGLAHEAGALSALPKGGGNAATAFFSLAQGGSPELESLYGRLQSPDLAEARIALRELQIVWSRSGSPAMDLLLQKGHDALERGDLNLAQHHLSALTDHAPDFATAWHARARVWIRRGIFGPAIGDLQRALRLEPRYVPAISTLAELFELLGHRQLAHRAWYEAFMLFPANPEWGAALERTQPRQSPRV